MDAFLKDPQTGENIGHWRAASPYTYHGKRGSYTGRAVRIEEMQSLKDPVFPPEEVWWSWSKSKRRRFRNMMRRRARV